MNIVERAEQIAREAHAGQTDKAGRPYIEHVERVAAAVADDPDQCVPAIAWLHDVQEDCALSHTEAVQLGMPARIVEAVDLLSRRDDRSHEQYDAAIKFRPWALKVKLADIADNSDESRLRYLDDATQARLRRKYAKAREALGYECE